MKLKLVLPRLLWFMNKLWTISPFLKGLHLSLCKHLPKRDREGWKLSDDSFSDYLQVLLGKGEIDQIEFL